MNKRNIRWLVSIFILFYGANAFAGSASGLVHFLYVGGWDSATPNVMAGPNGPLVFFTVDGYTGGPACATQKRFVLDLTTRPGKTQYATLMIARINGLAVTVQGTTDCRQWSDSESIQYLTING